MNSPDLKVARPWKLTFSYGRALQKSVLQTWKGQEANKKAAQDMLLKMAKANGDATLGKYEGGVGSQASSF